MTWPQLISKCFHSYSRGDFILFLNIPIFYINSSLTINRIQDINQWITWKRSIFLKTFMLFQSKIFILFVVIWLLEEGIVFVLQFSLSMKFVAYFLRHIGIYSRNHSAFVKIVNVFKSFKTLLNDFKSFSAWFIIWEFNNFMRNKAILSHYLLLTTCLIVIIFIGFRSIYSR